MEPTVTAVMITGKHASRVDLALAAIRSFDKQIYKNKDLLIINDGAEPLFTNAIPLNIRELQLPKGMTLGELRNVGLAEATGDLIMQWDDDDWSHPIRMGYQVKAWEQTPSNAVLLKWQVRYSFITDSAKYWGWTDNHPTVPGIPGTILHANTPNLSYRSESRAEDDHFLEDHFGDRITVLENSPAREQAHYYVRFYHGGNTWSEKHVMGGSGTTGDRGPKGDRGPGGWDLDQGTQDYLKSLLKYEYAERLR